MNPYLAPDLAPALVQAPAIVHSLDLAQDVVPSLAPTLVRAPALTQRLDLVQDVAAKLDLDLDLALPCLRWVIRDANCGKTFFFVVSGMPGVGW